MKILGSRNVCGIEVIGIFIILLFFCLIYLIEKFIYFKIVMELLL